MSKVVEDPVTTPEKAPTGKEAFSRAKASVSAQSPDHGVKDSDDTSTPKPAEDPAKVTDQPTDVTEEPHALLSPEELAELSPKDRAKAEKWQAKLTQRSQALSATEKEFEAWKPLIDALKSNEHADAAIKQLAEKRGLKLAEVVKENTALDIPDELKFLEPILTKRDQALEAKIRAELAPVKDGMDRITSEAIAAETEATLTAFEADPKFKDWRKHEPRMLELAQQFQPANGMTDRQFLQNLYILATAEIGEAEKTKKVIERINKSASSVEPNTSGIPNERVEHALPPPGKRSMRDAFHAAKNGVRWSS